MLELQAAIMGLVEGLTEFLPVSSTGHLILAGRWLGFEQRLGRDVAATFEIFIQAGAILAVLAAHPGRFAALADVRRGSGFSGWRGISLLVLTSVPALIAGTLARESIKGQLFAPWSVALGLAAGAVWILVVEWRRPQARTESLDDLRWWEALAIGLFQCLALWPGVSRSGATILGGMMLGVDRKTATEYSFFAAVPVLLAAALWDLWNSLHHLQPSHASLFGIGLAVSLVSAFLAVKWLLRFVASHTLTAFAWYRMGLAAAVFVTLQGG